MAKLDDRRPQLLVRSGRTYRRPHTLRQALVLIIVLVIALLVLGQAILPRSAHAAQPPEPAPCTGKLVRIIDTGAELVRKPNGRLCVRSAIVKPSRQMVRP